MRYKRYGIIILLLLLPIVAYANWPFFGNFGPSSGMQLVATDSTGPFRMITADGDATIYSGDTDLSGYQSYYIQITDSSGNTATAYGHSGDDAEAFGSELLTDGDMEADPTNNWLGVSATLAEETVTINGGSKALKATATASPGRTQQSFTTETGKLYKAVAYRTNDAGDKTRFRVWMSDTNIVYDVYSDRSAGYEEVTRYLNAVDTGGVFIMDLYSNTDVGYLDDCSVKEVTALGATALQLRDAPTGSTRNLTSKDASFDPNNIAEIKIFSNAYVDTCNDGYERLADSGGADIMDTNGNYICVPTS